MILLLEDKRYYVYAYLDPRKQGFFKYDEIVFDYEPFYIGKGYKERKFDHIKDADNVKFHNYKLNKIRKIKSLGLNPIITEVFTGISENKAHDEEKRLIAVIGRKDLNKGPLLNLTDGGEGAHGAIKSAETRAKFSKIHKGRKITKIVKIVKENAKMAKIRKKGKKSKNDGKWLKKRQKSYKNAQQT